MSLLTPNEIKAHLPHRYPFLLIDQVTQLEAGTAIVAIKNVSFNEPFFNGHFPEEPVMPGVLIVEAMAQAGGILIQHTNQQCAKESGLYFFAGIDHARFKRVVVPGDQLRIEVRVEKARKLLWKFQAQAFVGDELAAEATLMTIKNK